MATKRFLGQAGAVIQIDEIALGGTFAAGEQVSVQIGHSTLAVILGSGQTTPALVATVIKNAINARSIDEALQSTETRLNAGQLLGEFRDVNAIIDPASTSNVLVRSNVAGVPFGTPNSGGPINAVVVDTDSASGTIAQSSIQAATGPCHWDNAANWDSGTVPANGDKALFKGTNASVRYGLPNNSLRIFIDQWKDHTGDVGLPEVNTTNANGSYYEYRQRYVRLDNNGSSTAVSHNFGLGNSGAGSPLININHSLLQCFVTVYGTGLPKVAGTKSLNICCAVGSTLNMVAGSVDCSSQDGSSAAYLILNQSGGDLRGVSSVQTTSVLAVSGGNMLIGGATAITRIDCNGGVLLLEDQTGTIATLNGFGGEIDYQSTAMVSALTLNGARFDATGGVGAFTVTACDIYKGSQFIDPSRRCIMSAPVSLYFDPSADLQFGASVPYPITIQN